MSMTIWIVTIHDHLKTQEMCDEAVRTESLSLVYVPDRFKTQKMCSGVVCNKPCMLLFVPDHFWTHEMCNEVMRNMQDAFHRIPDRFKTQEMCDKAVKKDPSFLEFVTDWLVRRECMQMWYDDYYDDNADHWDNENDEDKFFEWDGGYEKRKAQKASIKEELLPIACHP